MQTGVGFVNSPMKLGSLPNVGDWNEENVDMKGKNISRFDTAGNSGDSSRGIKLQVELSHFFFPSAFK